jgi:hypothetical protein
MWGLAFAVSKKLVFKVTLAAFLAIPCTTNGVKHACSTAKGSFARAMTDAIECEGRVETDARDGAPFYYAVCPEDECTARLYEAAATDPYVDDDAGEIWMDECAQY